MRATLFLLALILFRPLLISFLSYLILAALAKTLGPPMEHFKSKETNVQSQGMFSYVYSTVEVGVQSGGPMEMWQLYFGPEKLK